MVPVKGRPSHMAAVLKKVTAVAFFDLGANLGS